MDGNGTLLGTLSGNTREILYKFAVDLPKKHGRGGQSALRFARLRLEKRHNYLRKVAEVCTQYFINQSENKPNVAGLILSGLADFKNDLYGSELFDPRLKKVVVKIVDTSYGFENGFNQAIELSKEALKDVKFIQEKDLIGKFFEEIAQDTGKYCFGVRDCLYALDTGAVETLIVYENLDLTRFQLINSTGAESVLYLTEEQERNTDFFKDAATGEDLETKDRMPLCEWLAENYKSFGCSLQFVTDKSQEGSQFVKGFGGIGGLLRYKLDFVTLDENPENQVVSSGSDYEWDY